MATLPTTAIGNRNAGLSDVNTSLVGAEPVLELIASPNDATFVQMVNNQTITAVAAFELGGMPGDFATMDTLAVRLRYAWTTTPNGLLTWNNLTAQVVNSAGTTLSNAVTLASSITTTTKATTSVVPLTGLNTTANKATWDGAVVLIRFQTTRSMGGDGTANPAVYAGEITGTYTEGATSFEGTVDVTQADQTSTASGVVVNPDGGSWVFDGVDDWVGIAANAAQQTPSTAVTLAGWFRPGAGQDGTLWSMAGKKHTAGTSPHISYDMEHGSSSTAYHGQVAHNTNNWTDTPAATVTTGVWQFWAVTWSSGNPIRFRVWDASGSLVANVTSGTITSTIPYGALGVQLAKNGPSTRFWAGHCAYFGATDSVLSDTDLDTWRTTGVPPATLSAFFLPLNNSPAVDTAQGGTVSANGGAVWDPNEGPPLTTGNSGTVDETQDDQTGAAAGHLSYTGALAETQDDQTLAASGHLSYSGSLAETEADDTLAASGTSTSLGTAGSLDETQDDQTLAASGTSTSLGISGAVDETQDDQTLAASGTTTVAGVSGSGTPVAADDTLAAEGTLGYAGAVEALQSDDTVSAQGHLSYSGSLAQNEADDDLDATGSLSVPGGIVITQDSHTLSATGHLSYTGTVDETEADDTVEADGHLSSTGTLAETQDDQTGDASGAYTAAEFSGAADVTQDDQTVAASGTFVPLPITGTIDITQDDQVAEAFARIVHNFGAIAVTQDDATADIDGLTFTTAGLAVTQDNQTADATGHLAYVGSGAPVEADDTLFAFEGVPGKPLGTMLPLVVTPSHRRVAVTGGPAELTVGSGATGLTVD